LPNLEKLSSVLSDATPPVVFTPVKFKRISYAGRKSKRRIVGQFRGGFDFDHQHFNRYFNRN
jgi:hypothetical protein